MTDDTRFMEFEKELSAVFASAASDDFVNKLQAQLNRKVLEQSQHNASPFYLRPAWMATFLVLLVLLVSFFAIGPARVTAAVQKLLGYVPGSGLVSTETPLRVLAEPVEQTRDGVTFTVTSALLSADKTQIMYNIFGIPRSAYPDSEAISGCYTQPYLRLPDGSKLERMDDFPAIPASVNEAVLVIPCLAGTLPGKAPENWELPLRFIPAPAGFTVLPVEEATPTLTADAQSTAEEQTPAPDPNAGSITVTRVIDTETGYILVVAFQPGGAGNGWVQQTGMPTITDAAGNAVAYSIPVDVMNSLPADPSGADVMAYQFNASGVAFPVTLRYKGVRISVTQPDASTSFVFDAGAAPQPGQEWPLNQTLELAGHTLVLETVNADSRGGYSFHFKTDAGVNGVGATIEGYQANGGGGGGGMSSGEVNVSISYAVRPTGALTVVLSNLSEITDEIEWSAQWSPSTARTDIPSTPQLVPGVCVDSAAISRLAPLPAAIQGKALLAVTNADGTSAVVLTNLDGSAQVKLTDQAGWAALSGNGEKVVTLNPEGFFVMYDVASASTTQLNIGGYNPRLSNRGTQLAYVEGAAAGIDVYDLETRSNRQVSNQAFFSVLGWSADDTKLYVAVMSAGGSAWKIQSIDVQTGNTESLFIIENGTAKFLNPKISPDGEWIAYRGRDNSSVYLVHPDGSGMHLVVDALGAVGIEFGRGGWLGVSLQTTNPYESTLALIKPDTCEAYLLPAALNGELEGLFIQ